MSEVEAVEAARLASTRIDHRRAAIWYAITRSGACAHPREALAIEREPGLSRCHCTACNHRFKEVG